MDLSEAVHAFDGKHVADLAAVAAGFSQGDADRLAELCESEVSSHRVAATWIVKSLCDDGQAHKLDMARCFATLTEDPWDAALHLLQCVQHEPAKASAQRLKIEALLQHPKTLVRVWALDALVRCAIGSDGALTHVRALVAEALADDKASVRARARKLADLLDL